MRRCLSATSLFALVWLLLTGSAFAAPVGQVTNLSGPLFAVGVDGMRRVLSMGSPVEPGETLITEGNTYAQVRFIDKGVVTLKPGTQFKVENFAFDEKAPEKDSASFGLFKGALRAVSGLVGKRGNQDAYKMNTPTATIGIRGTQFIVQFVPEAETAISLAPYALPLLARLDARWSDTLSDAMPDLIELPASFELAQTTNAVLTPGTYVHVLVGAIVMGSSLPTLPGVPALPTLPSVVIPSGSTGFAAPPPRPGVPPPPPAIIPTPPALVPSFAPPSSFQVTQNQAQQGPAGQVTPPAIPNAPAPAQQGGPAGAGGGCVVR